MQDDLMKADASEFETIDDDLMKDDAPEFETDDDLMKDERFDMQYDNEVDKGVDKQVMSNVVKDPWDGQGWPTNSRRPERTSTSTRRTVSFCPLQFPYVTEDKRLCCNTEISWKCERGRRTVHSCPTEECVTRVFAKRIMKDVCRSESIREKECERYAQYSEDKLLPMVELDTHFFKKNWYVTSRFPYGCSAVVTEGKTQGFLWNPNENDKNVPCNSINQCVCRNAREIIAYRNSMEKNMGHYF